MLYDIVHIGSQDIQFINQYYELVSDRMDFSNLSDMPIGQITANTLIYEIFYCINTEVFLNIKNRLMNNEIEDITKTRKNKLLKICDDRLNEFSPYINCTDSWFQNECDQVNIKEKTLEKICEDVFDLLM